MDTKLKTTKLNIKILPSHTFGTYTMIGKHSKPDSLYDLEHAINDALTDGFETLYIYNSLPALDLFFPYIEKTFGNDCTKNEDSTITIYFWS